ncbi:MAG: hypothetical protein A3H64_01035 [Candidatus Ryanbacteria bacterium RIFCSPLOWO2_02_FULL_45_11c]|uniref:Uncharacterized protein n=1 Tax=Candidatus Ryanbacteria bacterium RIFCSPLOWO2_02_FULL_45_11c TaxID=1802128 RepID=A0A1G2H202_9BACT|nr:MAG: hypothetical protein A3H64_01035 [Candidatus Ryanbacteria bacterium RIFCSPLOWO2_02_FULL_45_11c]
MLKTNITLKKDLHTIIRKEVVDVMTELLSDPDAGLELSPAFERKLKKSATEKAKGKITPLSEVFAQFSR